MILGVSGAEYIKTWASPFSASKLTKFTGLESNGLLAKAA
jgi:hypothetical protein